MSSGIDKQFVREYYQRMSDKEMITILRDLTGLTPEAQEVVREEITRRNLDVDISGIAAQEEEEYLGKAFDPDACPVGEDTRVWLENAILLLLDIFGKDETLKRKILTPESRHFPVKYDGSERCAFETLAIVARQMETPLENIKLDFYDENLRHITEGNPGGLYWGKGENDKFEISLGRKWLDEPENMVAVLAHEIAHIKLLGDGRMEENNEQITDLTTIFFGLGIFNANAAFQWFADNKRFGWSESGYLTQMEWGYALALFAYIRDEDEPAWAEHLCKNVRADFQQGINFIANNPGLIFKEP
ncbi:hypothetical protein ACQ86N_38985 [Puia sp. P3]|uniref:hypothetical protein n=1 Tax=Puia sp. P3 TaxID=3423952 RepID=UPI003D673C87